MKTSVKSMLTKQLHLNNIHHCRTDNVVSTRASESFLTIKEALEISNIKQFISLRRKFWVMENIYTGHIDLKFLQNK